jgi:hypothetical protein
MVYKVNKFGEIRQIQPGLDFAIWPISAEFADKSAKFGFARIQNLPICRIFEH